MAEAANQAPASIQELLISSLAQTDALAKVLIEKALYRSMNFSRRLPPKERHINAC
jgi:hypothetical protein